MLNAGDAMRDLAGYKFKSATWTLVIEENPVDAEHVVGFAIVHGQMKPRHFTDAIGATGMKVSGLPLRNLSHLAKHFAGAGEIEAAIRLQFPKSCQHVVGAVNIRGHC